MLCSYRRVAPWLSAAVLGIVLVSTSGGDDKLPRASAGVTGKTAGCEHCQCCDPKAIPKRYTRTTAAYVTPDVVLVGADGESVSLAKVLDTDKPVMLQFVFTTCSTICPVLTGTFATFQDKLGDGASGVRMVSISIDPEHDRPERLRLYAESHGAKAQWRFYTGKQPDIESVQKAFGAFRGNKMAHEPLTLMRPSRGASWVRLNGLLSGSELLAEYRDMVGK